ncbi:MAG TPA: transcription termination factor NusA [Alphaproteobacteria bacterium]|jgi:N utilization substance protein A|nr:transcription termination factor NusA [Alphaproteobacteria bacterium]
MPTLSNIQRHELLQVADAVAREKNINREEILMAMEMAIQKAGKAKYGNDHDIRTKIDRRTGEVKLFRYLQVVDNVENEVTQISVPEAQKQQPGAKLGDFLTEELPPIDLGRISAQTAKQVIVQKVREVERQHEYEEYKDRKGEIINGVVRRVEFGNVTIELGKAEAMLRRDMMLPRETFRPGDRVRALIADVRSDSKGSQIVLSRTSPEFMAKLFTQEVPEIYNKIIEIKSVARDPGSRAKMAVYSRDSNIDPVGACVGIRGSRVQAIVNELQGEKVDIVPWSSDQATFVVNSLAPAEVSKVVLDEETKRIEVVVPDDQLSLAIGRKGQNVRLASELTGWEIDILTEAAESERRAQEFKNVSQVFVDALDIDEVIAHLLITEGFTKVEEVAYVGLDELEKIEGFDQDLAQQLQERAKNYIQQQQQQQTSRWQDLGVDGKLADVPGLTPELLVTLGEQGVKTLQDFADLSSDELISSEDGLLRKHKLNLASADQMIMAARHMLDNVKK